MAIREGWSVSKRGWQEAADELGLAVEEVSEFGMPAAIGGSIGRHDIEIFQDPDSIRDTSTKIIVTVPLETEAVFTVSPYRPPRRGVPAFHKPTITADPPFNVRFTIDATGDNREPALRFLDARRRSLLMSLQEVAPRLTLSVRPETSQLTCSSDRRPNGDKLIRIVRAKLRVAEALAADLGGKEQTA